MLMILPSWQEDVTVATFDPIHAFFRMISFASLSLWHDKSLKGKTVDNIAVCGLYGWNQNARWNKYELVIYIVHIITIIIILLSLLLLFTVKGFYGIQYYEFLYCI